MGAFDGIDPVQEQAIRRALKKEIRAELTEELSDEVRRQVERDVRDETRRDVLQEIAERTPTAAERDTFSAYVNEVRLDAYAQATMASEIADQDERQLTRSRQVISPLLTLLVVALPLLALASARVLGGFSSPSFIAAALTACLGVLALWIARFRRHHELEQRSRQHRRIASDFLIIAERAKAFAMVHAERLATTGELHEVLEDLRREKERHDRSFHASAPALEAARALVGPRIANQDMRRIAPADTTDDEEVAPPGRRRTRAR